MVTVFSLTLVSSVQREIQTDTMLARGTALLDLLTCGPGYSAAPYLLNSTRMDELFASGDAAIRSQLNPGWDYSLSLTTTNNVAMKTVGSTPASNIVNVIALQRMVTYNSTAAKLVVRLWQ